MDTLTHTLVGLGLSKIALIVPQTTTIPETQQALFWASMIGSHAPDFDIVTRFKSKTTYLKHHRGYSHSLLFQVFISSLLTLVLHFIYPRVFIPLIFLWTLLSTFIHLILDLFTPHGIQLLLPIKTKKYAWDILMIIDIPLMLTLMLGLYFIRLGFSFFVILLTMSSLAIFYIFYRISIKTQLQEKIRTYFHPGIIEMSLIPTLRINKWHYIVKKSECYYVGKISPKEIVLEGVYSLEKVPPPLLDMAFLSKKIRVFYQAARHPLAIYKRNKAVHKLEFRDLSYPASFNRYASITLDTNFRIIDSTIQLNRWDSNTE